MGRWEERLDGDGRGREKNATGLCRVKGGEKKVRVLMWLQLEDSVGGF